MDRRKLIKIVTLATGSMMSVPLMNSLLLSCDRSTSKKVENYKALFFNDEDFSLIRDIIDTIIPRTDSPSATDVGVHYIIDTMVAQVYSPSQQENYSTQFSALKKVLNNSTESIDVMLKSILKSEDSETRNGLTELRQQTIAYYLSTEEVSKNHLNYLPVPGDYEPCIKLESVNGKAWAI